MQQRGLFKKFEMGRMINSQQCTLYFKISASKIYKIQKNII